MAGELSLLWVGIKRDPSAVGAEELNWVATSASNSLDKPAYKRDDIRNELRKLTPEIFGFVFVVFFFFCLMMTNVINN
jgi:hypothetical protein